MVLCMAGIAEGNAESLPWLVLPQAVCEEKMGEGWNFGDLER